MNRFANSTPPETAPYPLQQRAARQALTVFLSCLVIGGAVLVWRMVARGDNALARARTEALARGLALESQFNQAIAAADVLGALARQSGGVIPNFQQVATELYQSHPGLATLELQPGGVVSDIVPRAGFERVIGVNVVAHPAYHASVQAALRARHLTLSGPLPLYRGEPGFVARVPVFQRARDGREVCWGFIAVSLRLQEALSRARLDTLAAQDYDYHLFAPAMAGQETVTLAKRGQNSFSRAEHQVVRAQNLEFRLAVQPRRGWVRWTRILVEALGVLGVSALAGLLVVSVQQWRGLGVALAQSETRLARESTEGKKAREELLKAEETAETVRAKLNQAEQINAQLKERLETTAPSAQQTTEGEREKLRQAEAIIAELQGQVESSARAAMETTEAAQSQLGQTAAAIAELQARLNASDREAKEAAETALARAKEKEKAIADLQTRLDDAGRQAKESAEAAATRLSQQEQTIADLQTRLEASVRDAQASGAKLRAAEETIRELQSKHRAAEEAQTRVVERAAPVHEAQSEAGPSAPSQPAPAAPEASQSAAREPASKPVKRKKVRHDNQLSLFAEGRTVAETPSPGESHVPVAEAPAPPVAPTPAEAEEPPPAETAEPEPARKEEKRPPVRPLPPSPPVNLSQLRKAVSEILPLLTGHDPGAKDCLKDNRTAFRSAFSPEGYVEFEQAVKGGNYDEAVQQLKKAARKHGISA